MFNDPNTLREDSGSILNPLNAITVEDIYTRIGLLNAELLDIEHKINSKLDKIIELLSCPPLLYILRKE